MSQDNELVGLRLNQEDDREVLCSSGDTDSVWNTTTFLLVELMVWLVSIVSFMLLSHFKRSEANTRNSVLSSIVFTL